MEIYKITNTITNDFYIGSAVNYKNRIWGHISFLRKNKHDNRFIQNSWNKYGEKVFTFEIIEIVDVKENLIIREQYWIDTLSPTFNIAKIAGSPLGVKHSEKSRLNMSLAHKGLSKEQRGHKENCNCCICNRKNGNNSPRYIQREERTCACGCGNKFVCRVNEKKRFVSGHNKPQLGRIKTVEQIEKQKQSLKKYYAEGGKNPNLNKKISDEIKLKISDSKSIPILQFDLNNDFIREWKSAKLAGISLNISISNIGKCLRGKRKTANNFIWKYKQ